MNLLQDIITYVRRIIKSPSNADITDSLIIDYINRFWIMDVDARIQTFDMKNKYQFQTTPGVDKYNMPLYSVQSETPGDPTATDIAMYPVYQGFLGPAYINGIEVQFQTQRSLFYKAFPNVVQGPLIVEVGDGTPGPYTLNFQILPSNTTPINQPINAFLRGHVDIAGIMALGSANDDPPFADNTTFPSVLGLIPTTSIDSAVFITTSGADGSNIVVADSGVFLSGNSNCGMLMEKGKAPYGNSVLAGNYSATMNTINYLTGECTLEFNENIPVGTNINAQVFFFQGGLPRSILYYNNTLTLRVPPSNQYLVELDAYLTPAAFFNTDAAVPFAYMSEYIARGAARKILSDTGDTEQFMFYEPLFREQEILVWKRSQRQFTATRTPTIYSQGNQSNYISNPFSGSSQ